jgi:hypothetical protein
MPPRMPRVTGDFWVGGMWPFLAWPRTPPLPSTGKLLRSAAQQRHAARGMQFLRALFKLPTMPCGGRGGGILQQFTLTTVYT